MKFFTDAGFLPAVKYVSNDIENTILAVAAGLGYALLPAYFTQSLNLDDRVIALPIVGCDQTLTVAAAWKPENTNLLLPHFLALI
jgi:DNA-binding transcriptional LysR family regulator